MLKHQFLVYICNSNQGKRYTLSLLVLGLLFLIFYLFNNCLNNKLTFFKHEIQTLEIKKAQLNTVELETKISHLQGQITKGLLKKDPNNDRLFLNLARNTDLKVISYLPEEFNTPHYCKTKYKLSLSGSFDDIYGLFNKLAEAKSTIKCCKLKLTNQDGIINLETIYNCYLTNEKQN